MKIKLSIDLKGCLEKYQGMKKMGNVILKSKKPFDENVKRFFLKRVKKNQRAIAEIFLKNN